MYAEVSLDDKPDSLILGWNIDAWAPSINLLASLSEKDFYLYCSFVSKFSLTIL